MWYCTFGQLGKRLPSVFNSFCFSNVPQSWLVTRLLSLSKTGPLKVFFYAVIDLACPLHPSPLFFNATSFAALHCQLSHLSLSPKSPFDLLWVALKNYKRPGLSPWRPKTPARQRDEWKRRQGETGDLRGQGGRLTDLCLLYSWSVH